MCDKGDKDKSVQNLIDLFEKRSKPPEKSGKVVQSVLPEIKVVIDAHMHVCSSFTIPLPLLWNQMPGIVSGFRRSWYDEGGLRPPKVRKEFGAAWEISKNSEDEIGRIAVAENNSTYENTPDPFKDHQNSQDTKRLGVMVAMPMDMEYAQYDGYSGEKIYQSATAERDDLIELQKAFLRKAEALLDQQAQDLNTTFGSLTHILGFIAATARLLKKSPSYSKNNSALEKEFHQKAKAIIKKGKKIDHPTVQKNNPGFVHERQIKMEMKRAGGDHVGFAAVLLGLMRDYHPDALIEGENLDPDQQINNAIFEMDESVSKTLSDMTVKEEETRFAFMHNARADLGFEKDKQLSRYFYWDKPEKDAKGNARDRKRIWLDKEEFSMFEIWKQQFFYTRKATRENPWQIMPLYHYEPRRWIDRDGNEHWQKPFDQIASTGKNGLFIGFKMYTRLGYKPLDPKLPRMADYYRECEAKKIPVLVHCTRGGMGTHHEEYYLEFEPDEGIRKKYTKKGFKKKQGKLDYFADHFVHPEAWREVLKKFPKLYLCLAHFGGGDTQWQINPDEDIDKNTWIKTIIDYMLTYENFYTDVSYVFLEESIDKMARAMKAYPKIIEKIMFGTDWYMTEIGQHRNYKDFCVNSRLSINEIYVELDAAKALPDHIKSAGDLWVQLAAVNPFNFHRLDANAKRFHQALKSDNHYYQTMQGRVDDGLNYLKFFYENHQRKGFFTKGNSFAT